VLPSDGTRPHVGTNVGNNGLLEGNDDATVWYCMEFVGISHPNGMNFASGQVSNPNLEVVMVSVDSESCTVGRVGPEGAVKEEAKRCIIGANGA
jgi:hypothetical protein